MLEASPWDEIVVPNADFNVRQVRVDTIVPCFWGRDAFGACLFIVELQGDHSSRYRKSMVTVKGVDADLRASDMGRQNLVLTLEKHVNRDLFEGLCRSLVFALKRATDSASSLEISLAHIRRWKAFLSGRGQYLTADAVRGLFAELVFLEELLYRGMPNHNAVEAWLGPERSHQDFIFGNTAVEIKSLSGKERSSVRISSEDQLESVNDDLFLRIYRLNSISDAQGARSLNELISSVQARLGDTKALEIFERKLVAFGYAPLPDYDEPRFVISDVNSYRVMEGFPRLIQAQLPEGVTKVAYDIRLETIAKFECNGMTIFRDI